MSKSVESASSLPGPPELHADLGAHFLAVARLIDSAATLASPTPTIRGPQVQVPEPDPVDSFFDGSPVLTPFWREHPNLYSFLLVSLSKFHAINPPVFTQASVSDPVFVPGHYSIGRFGIKSYNATTKKWQNLFLFKKADYDCFPSLTNNFVMFYIN
jgi:hypothetical protein